MKKTFNVNIGSVAFSLNEDAYYTLKGYFADIRSRLDSADIKEIMEEVESRVAEIFQENISFPSQVVDIDIVRRAIAIIGSGDTFGDKSEAEQRGEAKDEKKESAYSRLEELRKTRLYRSRTDNVIGGVCGGVAKFFDMDPTIVRLILVFFFLFGGVGFLVYIVMWIIIPMEPAVTAGGTQSINHRN